MRLKHLIAAARKHLNREHPVSRKEALARLNACMPIIVRNRELIKAYKTQRLKNADTQTTRSSAPPATS